MTYKHFIKESKKRQRAYIASEKDRYTKAQRLWRRYQAAMNAMDLHALNGMEIHDRLCELDRMERDVEATHGDTPAMRAIFEARP